LDGMEPVLGTSSRYFGFGLSNQMASILGGPTCLTTHLIFSKLQSYSTDKDRWNY
jgi:hypothetical protein